MDWETALDVFVHGDGDGEYEPPAIPKVEGLTGIIEHSICSKPFEKQLTKSDLSLSQRGLLLCKSDVEECLLPLLNDDEDIREGIPVITYTMDGKKYRMVFQLRISRNFYVLGDDGWIQFQRENDLEVEDSVTIWMFRHVRTKNLCFVIARSAYFIRN
ncbi:hypothetical protein Patl1_02613 [Pistacia atlantica]|uniref:Uncharacterized protein n=1 Tax=Pistacia atlantica TaxID=434234 RepID=A0ACC1CBF1_9ROSI|nr:hypothetical protein Patl1_02613 [Pistacia atlantica]